MENRTYCDVTISQSKVRRVQKNFYTTGDLFIPYPNDNFQLNLKSDGLKPDPPTQMFSRRFSSLIVFFSTKLRLKVDTIPEVILPGYGTGPPVYNLAPQLTHRMAMKNHSNISVNPAVISDLIQSPEYTADPLKGENKDPLWPWIKMIKFKKWMLLSMFVFSQNGHIYQQF